MKRSEMLDRAIDPASAWDLLVIGGGATGLGVGVDAAARGHKTLLLEAADFAKGTSGRSTKLVHGGVRYLQQGNVALVMEALRERGRLRRNAPHLVRDLAFVVPSYDWWESPFYGIGLKVYDALAGRYGFGRSKMLSKERVVEAIPTIDREGLRGGTLYYDGQFDDARLAINLATTAAEQGAALVNYMGVTGLMKDRDGHIEGVHALDEETGQTHEIRAKVVINATGPFSDAVRRMDRADAPNLIAPSQGVHIVVDQSFLPGETAIMVPRTDDGRVMFAIPWRDVALIGTTDTPIDDVSLEPVPLRKEIEFILETANEYLARDIDVSDVKSVFAGIRPLAKAGGGDDTASISREHAILIDPVSGLLTIAGGKWTTYRRMGEQVVDNAETLAGLEQVECSTKRLPIHGHHEHAERFGDLAEYGADAPEIESIVRNDESLGERIHPDLPIIGAEIVWAAREEMARTVDDALSRRTRALILDAAAASAAAPRVAELLARELSRDEAWAAEQARRFQNLARSYRVDAPMSG